MITKILKILGFSQSVEHFFLPAGQNNFGNKISNMYIFFFSFFLRSFMEKYMHQNVSVGKTMRRGPTLLWWGHCMHILRCYLGFFSQNILLWTLERTAVPTRHLCAITDYGHPISIYLHLIFAILQFEILTLMKWIFFPVCTGFFCSL